MSRGKYIRTKPNWNMVLQGRDTTKSNYDERLAKIGEAISKASKGKRSWSKGLTKKTDKRVAKRSKNREHPNSEKAKINMKGHCGVFIRTLEHNKNNSKAQIKKFKDPENRKIISDGIKKLYADPKSIYNDSKYKREHKRACNTFKAKESFRQSAIKRTSDPKWRENHSEKIKEKWRDPESIYNSKDSKNLRRLSLLGRWRDSEFQKMMQIANNKKPNNLEKYFDELTPVYVRYVGDFSFWIITKSKTHNPDFKVHNQKKIIELFGDYWHKGENPNELIKEYKKVGWDCKVFWEYEVYNDSDKVLKETLEFINK